MTGERTVSYTYDPIHWRTKHIQDIMRESKDVESESEQEQSVCELDRTYIEDNSDQEDCSNSPKYLLYIYELF